jgi:hypothetical protein
VGGLHRCSTGLAASAGLRITLLPTRFRCTERRWRPINSLMTGREVTDSIATVAADCYSFAPYGGLRPAWEICRRSLPAVFRTDFV